MMHYPGVSFALCASPLRRMRSVVNLPVAFRAIAVGELQCPAIALICVDGKALEVLKSCARERVTGTQRSRPCHT